MSYRIRCFDGYDQLPESYQPILEEARAQGLYSRREWFECLVKHFYTQGYILRLYAVESTDTGKPLLMLPMCLTRADSAARGAFTLSSVAHFENHSPACILKRCITNLFR